MSSSSIPTLQLPKGGVARRFVTLANRAQQIAGNILEAQNVSIQEWAETKSFLNSATPALSEIEARTIYCSHTGQPIGQLDLGLIAMYRKIHAEADLQQMLAGLTLCATPAPHWNILTRESLEANKRIDPIGWFCFMVDHLLRREKIRYQELHVPGYSQRAWKHTADRLAWANSKSLLFAALRDECDLGLIIQLNEVIAGMDSLIGVGHLAIPFLRPDALGSNEALRQLHSLLSVYYEAHKTSKGKFYAEYGIKPNKVVRAVVTLPVNKFDNEDSYLDNLLDMVIDLGLDDEAADYRRARRFLEKASTDFASAVAAKKAEKQRSEVTTITTGHSFDDLDQILNNEEVNVVPPKKPALSLFNALKLSRRNDDVNAALQLRMEARFQATNRKEKE